MDYRLLLIPAVVIVIGIIVMITLNKRGKSSSGVAQNVMREFVDTQIPPAQNVNMNVINLLEDAVNAQHFWVVAYNASGMFLIPAKSNQFNQTIQRYEDLTPDFNWKKQLAPNMLTGNKSEDIDYVPCSAITSVAVDISKKKIQIAIGDAKKNFKYQSKDCFGANQEDVLNDFLHYLNQIQS